MKLLLVHLLANQILLFLHVNSVNAEHLWDKYNKLGCDYKKKVEDLNATFIISALFPMHTWRSGKYWIELNSVTWVEAFLYTLDQINRNESVLPNIKLGYDIRDSCDDEQVAVQHALDFMLESNYNTVTNTKNISHSSNNNNYDNTKYNNHTTVPKQDYDHTSKGNINQCICPNSDGVPPKMIAVIGGSKSSVSKSVSLLVNTRSIPQVSYASGSPTLSDKSAYPNFLRTVPSDLTNNGVIVQLLQQFNWTYVSMLSSDTDYGRRLSENFRLAIRNTSICLANDLLYVPTMKNNSKLAKTMQKLAEKRSKANIIVLWCALEECATMIQTAKQIQLTNILWIISTQTWVRKDDFIKFGITDQHLILLRTPDYTVLPFERHILKAKCTKNIWLKEVWNLLGFCLPDSPTPNSCCRDTKFTNGYLPLVKYETVIAAVHAVANGLHYLLDCDKNKNCVENIRKYTSDHNKYSYNLHSDTNNYVINNKTNNNYYDNSNHTNFGDLLVKAIKRTGNDFYVPDSEFQVHIDENGDENVNRYKLRLIRGTDSAEFGVWNRDTNILSINKTKFWHHYNISQTPEPNATCATPCFPGTYKIPESYVKCCWTCVQCPANKVSSHSNAMKCLPCKELETPNLLQTKCLPLLDTRLRMQSKSGRVLLAASAFGVLLTCIVMVVFAKYWESPVVKSSSREMSMVQLVCMLVLFALPILHFFQKSVLTCILQTITFAMFDTLMIVLVFVKTYRLHKVFQSSKFAQVSKYLKNQYIAASGVAFLAVQAIILGVYYSLNLPKVTISILRSGKAFVYSCGEKEEYFLYATIGYIIILSLVTGYMAFRARKLPSNFNEVQFILLAMFTSCLAWLLLYPLHLSSFRDARRKTIVFLGVNLASTFCFLIILYAYKVRIIVFYPELNSPEYFSKLAENATVKTFLKEVDPSDGTPRQHIQRQPVITFDFDTMFDEYRRNRGDRTDGIRKNSYLDFPTVQRIRRSIRKSLNKNKNKRKAENKKVREQRTVTKMLNDSTEERDKQKNLPRQSTAPIKTNKKPPNKMKKSYSFDMGTPLKTHNINFQETNSSEELITSTKADTPVNEARIDIGGCSTQL